MKIIAKRIPGGELIELEHEDLGKWLVKDGLAWIDKFTWPRDDGNPQGMQPPTQQALIRCPDTEIRNSRVSDPINARFMFVKKKMAELGIDLTDAEPCFVRPPQKQTEAEAYAELSKANYDRIIFGTGAIRTDAAGHVTHIPIMELELYVNEQVHTIKRSWRRDDVMGNKGPAT